MVANRQLRVSLNLSKTDNTRTAERKMAHQLEDAHFTPFPPSFAGPGPEGGEHHMVVLSVTSLPQQHRVVKES